MVPWGRLFIMPARAVGDRARVDHITSPTASAVEVETLSVSPRIFRLRHFVSEEEVQELIDNALEREDKQGLHRSTTTKAGSAEKTVDPYRTSDTAFDVDSAVSLTIKRRLFELIGVISMYP
ncbi:hypothetical protein B484DRAFT_424971 [Ochromonadaceae sp. CCMP2298]|nr:hypothetical protein B484DRAFT_424971 [Ochromonadaceae sp. CCMP2298]